MHIDFDKEAELLKIEFNHGSWLMAVKLVLYSKLTTLEDIQKTIDKNIDSLAMEELSKFLKQIEIELNTPKPISDFNFLDEEIREPIENKLEYLLEECNGYYQNKGIEIKFTRYNLQQISESIKEELDYTFKNLPSIISKEEEEQLSLKKFEDNFRNEVKWKLEIHSIKSNSKNNSEEMGKGKSSVDVIDKNSINTPPSSPSSFSNFSSRESEISNFNSLSSGLACLRLYPQLNLKDNHHSNSKDIKDNTEESNSDSKTLSSSSSSLKDQIKLLNSLIQSNNPIDNNPIDNSIAFNKENNKESSEEIDTSKYLEVFLNELNFFEISSDVLVHDINASTYFINFNLFWIDTNKNYIEHSLDINIQENRKIDPTKSLSSSTLNEFDIFNKINLNVNNLRVEKIEEQIELPSVLKSFIKDNKLSDNTPTTTKTYIEKVSSKYLIQEAFDKLKVNIDDIGLSKRLESAVFEWVSSLIILYKMQSYHSI